MRINFHNPIDPNLREKLEGMLDLFDFFVKSMAEGSDAEKELKAEKEALITKIKGGEIENK